MFHSRIVISTDFSSATSSFCFSLDLSDFGSSHRISLISLLYSLFLRWSHGHRHAEPAPATPDAIWLWWTEHGIVCTQHLCPGLSEQDRTAEWGGQIQGHWILSERWVERDFCFCSELFQNMSGLLLSNAGQIWKDRLVSYSDGLFCMPGKSLPCLFFYSVSYALKYLVISPTLLCSLTEQCTGTSWPAAVACPLLLMCPARLLKKGRYCISCSISSIWRWGCIC